MTIVRHRWMVTVRRRDHVVTPQSGQYNDQVHALAKALVGVLGDALARMIMVITLAKVRVWQAEGRLSRA